MRRPCFKIDEQCRRTFDGHVDLSPEADAITAIAEEVASESRLLCFDEFQVTDVADAIILGRILRVLFTRGTVLVATSNTPPSDLYSGGLNHRDFLPTIALLERVCRIHQISGGKDHRLLTCARVDAYFSPDKAAVSSVDQHLLTVEDRLQQVVDVVLAEENGGPFEPQVVPTIWGRNLKVPRSSAGICDWNFGELCSTSSDTGAADFQALCDHFHTVILREVPVLSAHEPKHNEARRFITLVDQLYESQTRLLCSAAALPADLFEGNKANGMQAPVEDGSGNLDVALKNDSVLAAAATASDTDLPSVKELRFAFHRAASRLAEMSSEEYLQRWQRARGEKRRPY